MLCGMFSVISLDPFLNSYVAYWHFADLGKLANVRFAPKTDLPC